MVHVVSGRRRVLSVLVITALVWVAAGSSVSYATLGSDDYPYKDKVFDSGLSPLRFYYKNCTDFVAWRLNQARGGTASNLKFTWASLPFPKSSTYPNGDGNARGWMAAATAAGYAVNTKPAVGAVAWRGPIPYSATGSIGHIAIVDRVNANGTIDYEDYNADLKGNYGYHANASASSFNRYLHIKDASVPHNRGDVTGDGMVDLYDLSTVLTQFGRSMTPNTGADVNGDGVVNVFDLSIVLSNYGKTS